METYSIFRLDKGVIDCNDIKTAVFQSISLSAKGRISVD